MAAASTSLSTPINGDAFKKDVEGSLHAYGELLEFHDIPRKLEAQLKRNPGFTHLDFHSLKTLPLTDITNLERLVKTLDPKRNLVLERKVSDFLDKCLTDARKKLAADEAYKIYRNSFNNPHQMKILGEENLRGPSPDAQAIRGNFGVVYTEKPLRDESYPLAAQGSVLYERNWSILINDTVILGAIHAKQDIYFSSSVDERGYPTLTDDSLYSIENQRTTALGREISMLHSAGYRCIKMHSPSDPKGILGFTMVCIDREKASNFRLSSTDWHQNLSKITSASDIRHLLADTIPYSLQLCC